MRTRVQISLLLVMTTGAACTGVDSESDTVDSFDQDGKADGTSAVPCKQGTLPVDLAIGPESSSIAVADLDNDGCTDVSSLSVTSANGVSHLSIVIRWGAKTKPFAKTTSLAVMDIANGDRFLLRDAATETIRTIDFDQDGKMDIVTAFGVASGQSRRKFVWQPFQNGLDRFAQTQSAVAVVDWPNEGRVVVRPNTEGGLERCNRQGRCVALINHFKAPPPGAPATLVTEVIVADFNHDNKLDILAAKQQPDELSADFTSIFRGYLYSGNDGFSAPVAVDDLNGNDIEVGDINRDGFLDIVAAEFEAINDFPGTSKIWLGGPTGFHLKTVIGNFQNHSDNAALVDVNNDKCLDIAQIGVDAPGINYQFGNCRGDFGAAPSGHPVVPAFPAGSLPAAGAVGVQAVDLNSDGIPELIYRGFVDDPFKYFLRIVKIK
jgi:hypothetical protein